MTATPNRASVERMMALCEQLADADPADYSTEKAWDNYRLATEPQHVMPLIRHVLSTMDRGDAAVRGEAVAWVNPLALIELRNYGRLSSANIWSEKTGPATQPLYASPPATPVAAGGDGRVVSDAHPEPIECPKCRGTRRINDVVCFVCQGMGMLPGEAAERTRNERASPSAAVTVSEQDLRDAIVYLDSIGMTESMHVAYYPPHKRESGFPLADDLSKRLQAALAAAPGGKEKA